MLGLLNNEKIKSLAQIKVVSLALEYIQKYKNFLMYAVIGASGATIDLVLFLILFNQFDFDKNLATVISTSAGIINNFTLNAVFNFKVKDHLLKRFMSFYMVGLSGLALTIFIFFIFIDLLKWNTNLVKVTSIVFVVAMQYTLNKNLSFKQKSSTLMDS